MTDKKRGRPPKPIDKEMCFQDDNIKQKILEAIKNKYVEDEEYIRLHNIKNIKRRSGVYGNILDKRDTDR